MFCPNCGLELPDDIKDICPACSYKLPFNEEPLDVTQAESPTNDQTENTVTGTSFNQEVPKYRQSTQSNDTFADKNIPASSVPNFLVWSIISTVFCCLPFGIVALVYSNKVNTYLIDKKYEKALHASNLAKIWNIVGTVCGVVMCIFYLAVFASSIFQLFGRFKF